MKWCAVPVGPWLAWGALAILLAIYTTLQLHRAADSALWMDETFSLRESIRPVDAATMLVRGVPIEASPAPLHSLLVKGLDVLRRPSDYCGLGFAAYWRLSSIAVLVFACVVGCVIAGYRPGPDWVSQLTQAGLMLIAAVALLFQPMNYHYAIEMRPYAPWSALWFVTLAVCLVQPRPGPWLLVCLLLLVATATAAVFQVAAVALAYFILGLTQRRSWSDLFREGVLIFALPLALAANYCLRAPPWSYSDGSGCNWDGFAKQWLCQWAWPGLFGLLAALLCFWRRETRVYAAPGLAVLILYLFGPAMFSITRWKGYFWAHRQYIFHDAALPILLLTLVRCVPIWFTQASPRVRLALPLGLLTLAVLATEQRCSQPLAELVSPTWLQPGPGVIADPDDRLARLLQTERPRRFVFTRPANMDAVANLPLFAEWLQTHYTALPLGERTVWLTAAAGRLTVLGVDPPLAEAEPWTVPCSSGGCPSYTVEGNGTSPIRFEP